MQGVQRQKSKKDTPLARRPQDIANARERRRLQMIIEVWEAIDDGERAVAGNGLGIEFDDDGLRVTATALRIPFLAAKAMARDFKLEDLQEWDAWPHRAALLVACTEEEPGKPAKAEEEQ
jgi:hypothetical protein